MIQAVVTQIKKLDRNEPTNSIIQLERRLKKLERGIQKQLLDKANVIFCTLSSAGATIVKQSISVEGLIVDEAAAALEPESYIPIAGSKPSRIMLAGDPQQLPATVRSPHVKTYGLEKSLQERLIFDEKQPHTMLDVQYRMRPKISSFPSSRFYGAKLFDGPNVMQPSYQTLLYRHLVTDQPYCFLHVDSTEAQSSPSRSFCNTAEAEMIVDLLIDLKGKQQGGQQYTV